MLNSFHPSSATSLFFQLICCLENVRDRKLVISIFALSLLFCTSVQTSMTYGNMHVCVCVFAYPFGLGRRFIASVSVRAVINKCGHILVIVCVCACVCECVRRNEMLIYQVCIQFSNVNDIYSTHRSMKLH